MSCPARYFCVHYDESEAVNTPTVFVTALHDIDARRPNIGVAEDIRELYDVPVHRVECPGEQVP